MFEAFLAQFTWVLENWPPFMSVERSFVKIILMRKHASCSGSGAGGVGAGAGPGGEVGDGEGPGRDPGI